MARLRLGVALLVPSPVAEEIDGLRRAVGDRSLSRVPPHITLVPPVNVAAADLGLALAVLRRAAASIRSRLTVTLGAPGTFLPANPVLYLPVGGDPDAVHRLRERVWYPPLTRSLSWPFVPHVTLADDAHPERIGSAVAALADYRARVTFDRVHLLVERRPGPHWRPLADAAFGPPAVVARGSPLELELTRSRQLDPEALAVLEAEGVDAVGEAEGVEGAGGVSGATGVEGLVPETPLPAPLVVTARRQGEVVGMAVTWVTDGGRRSEVFVAPGHRRQGVGRHLEAALETAINDARGADR